MRVNLSHWICAARGCGQIAHTKLGAGPDDCPSCGCSSWGEPTVNFASGISLTDQRLPDSCPVAAPPRQQHVTQRRRKRS